jgi:hypothetical protein
MTITAASKLRIGASTTLLSLLFILQENQPLDTLSSLIFAPYSSSFSHLKNGVRGKIRRGASKGWSPRPNNNVLITEIGGTIRGSQHSFYKTKRLSSQTRNDNEWK